MPPYTADYPDKPDVRRKSQRVFVDRATNDVILRLHETDIVRVRPNGDVILSTGGWATHKTLRSMNDALELFDMWVESTVCDVPRGDWVVYDTDGTTFTYTNNKRQTDVTIPARGSDARERCKWLAEAYDIPYTPTPAPQPQTVRAAARVVSAPPVPMQPAAAPAGPPPAAAAMAAPPRQAGGGGSWANIARTGTTPPSTGGAHIHRVTGPGGSGPAAAAGHPSSTAAAAPAPAGGLRALDVARNKLQAAAAAAAPVPARPVAEQLEAHMKQLGIHEDELEDDQHLCVVCMEHQRSIVLVPCGHMALCKACCETIVVKQGKECPMCCQPVEYHVEVDG